MLALRDELHGVFARSRDVPRHPHGLERGREPAEAVRIRSKRPLKFSEGLPRLPDFQKKLSQPLAGACEISLYRVSRRCFPRDLAQATGGCQGPLSATA